MRKIDLQNKEGDTAVTKEEFEARIIGMQDTLWRVSATILRQSCDREDAIQECIYKALRKRETLRDDRFMQSWVIRILINECYSIHRRAKWERPSEFIPEPPPQPGPDADPAVFRALFSLEEKMRLPVVLHYVEDLDKVYRCIHQTLRPGGVFLMNIEHPVFTAGVNQQFAKDGTWPVDDYYYPGKRQTDFLGYCITKYHHTLTQILNGLICAGFCLEAVEEAMPPKEWRAVMPDEMRRPMMLLVKAVKL
jgi:DNA-directed RNA polymerase specialized sigma24 family protein